MRAVLAQARVELVLTLRRGESVLLTLVIPVVLLLFFSEVDILPTGVRDPVDFLAPGILALAVMSTAMVGLGIATGFERQYGVLKRLGATPLGRPALLAAKTAAILAVEILQTVVLVVVALVLGWRPSGSVLAVGAALVLAAVAVGVGATWISDGDGTCGAIYKPNLARIGCARKLLPAGAISAVLAGGATLAADAARRAARRPSRAALVAVGAGIVA